MLARLSDAKPFVTKDGSEVRELLHPAEHGPGKMSLAEARVEPGKQTAVHRHTAAEEIYHVLSGQGRMLLGGENFEITAGDTIRIDPGVRHGLVNTGNVDLVVICCCCPPYAHDDTELE